MHHDKDDLTALFEKFLGERRHVDDLMGEAYTEAKTIERTFTAGVDFLRRNFRCKTINTLMRAVWDVIEHQYVLTVTHSAVATLSFAFMQRGLTQQAVICIPTDWAERVRQATPHEMGALVFVGSQAVDSYNERFRIDPEYVEARARAYEAEYLRACCNAAGFTPNAYQQKILAEFPRGVRTRAIRAHVYTPKAVVPVQGRA